MSSKVVGARIPMIRIRRSMSLYFILLLLVKCEDDFAYSLVKLDRDIHINYCNQIDRSKPAFGEVVDKVLGENNVLSKKDAWKLIDEKIRIAEERKEHETSGSMENKGNKKSHFWLDFRVLNFLILFCDL
jgi:hypothetical protein